ncbi:MAG: aspartate-semialdehyde dehydrogenase [Candidatus Omnitrophica bacterium]|nr:aspartate-semialdehyde dehydrogenase [Candidatus Omnitrophota bacterium]
MPGPKTPCRVCVVGVGAVGQELLRVLRQRRFPASQLTVLARSARDISVDGAAYRVQAISEKALQGQAIVLFAGTEGEKGAAVTFSPAAIRSGAVCIDNGSDFRMKPEVPLVIPEVNAGDLKNHKGLIANPNCSTIQMVAALAPIHRAFGLKRIIVSTYQAASGAGSKAAESLLTETSCLLADKPVPAPQALPQQLGFNVFPQIGPFEELGYTSEEWKMVRETQKILHDETIAITATTVRVPVLDAHSESIYFETVKPAGVGGIKDLWRASPGIALVEEPEYPMPIQAAHRDEVFVGRLRPDPKIENAFACWVVSDNLRKGAALNAVQIAECLIKPSP